MIHMIHAWQLLFPEKEIEAGSLIFLKLGGIKLGKRRTAESEGTHEVP